MSSLESALQSALERHLAGTPAPLAESIRYSLLAPGKRIRPRLTLSCAEMLGLPREAALPAALALEMVHCFTLIHDDLPCMDDDDFRRGRPSNHKVYGEATALLAGDGLMAVAVETLLEAEAHVTPAALLAALRRLSWAMGPRGVIGGQSAETLLTKDSSLDELLKMHSLKTGALFSASLLLAKDLAGIAGASAKSVSIDRFATELGIAFQVLDDLEDAEQDTKSSAEAPTSILFHLSESRARELFSARLKDACEDLSEAWGPGAGALLQIASEVAGKLAPSAGKGGSR